MTGGIVLAGGASSRMGRTKALLPCAGGRTFLGRLVDVLRDAGLEEIVAVAGRDAPGIEAWAAASGLRARVVRNPDPDRGQLSSLLVALDAFSPLVIDAVVVQPVDLPLVSPSTVRRVIAAWRASAPAAARPVRDDGRHGHPVVFSARLFGELRAADPGLGARPVLRAHAAEILDVPVEDAGAFEDVDTPADYVRLIGPMP